MALVKQESTAKMLRVPSAEEVPIQGVGGQSASSSQTATLLGLLVELQKTILEHVSSHLHPSQRSQY
jgi:hypothetical protein